MRDDQLKRLEAVQEKLLDVVVQEADPDTWPGAGKLMKDLTQEERGDRYWSKKNAAATLSLITKTLSIASYAADPHKPADIPSEEVDVDKEIARHEKAAGRLLKEFEARHGRTGVIGNA